jgi:hypothetical protein
MLIARAKKCAPHMQWYAFENGDNVGVALVDGKFALRRVHGEGAEVPEERSDITERYILEPVAHFVLSGIFFSTIADATVRAVCTDD